MEKRSSNRWDGKSHVVKKEVTGEGAKETTVRLVCVVGVGKYIVNGAVTGNHYEFVGNTPLDISIYDADSLLSKKRGGCCGNPPSPLFVKV